MSKELATCADCLDDYDVEDLTNEMLCAECAIRKALNFDGVDLQAAMARLVKGD